MLVERRYDRDRALTYAREWAMSRNPLFIDYTGFGGDCTNFVSQCLFAGSCRMNFTPVFGWYYLDADSRTASWTGVQYFYNFLTSNRGEGPFGVETDETNLRIGDVVQLQNEDGAYYHTLLVSGFDAADGILVAAHSNDAYDRPLSTYTYAAARFLQVSGVRVELDVSTGSCFYDLLGGIAIRA